MKLIALPLLLAPALALAQTWRSDLELSQPDAAWLMLAICGGLAFFWIKTATPDQRPLRLAVCAALLVGAVLLPPVRAVLALVAIVFLIYGFIRRT